MRIEDLHQRNILRWMEVVFHACLAVLAASSFFYDNPYLEHEEIMSAFMIVCSIANAYYKFHRPSVRRYQQLFMATSIAILFRPINAILTNYTDHVSPWTGTVNLVMLWGALYMLYAIKVLYIAMPYLEDKERQKKKE